MGFAIVLIQKGWWNGFLLYLKPEHRGRGFARAYHEESFRMAERAGLRGVQVISALPRLGRESNLFSKELHLVQGDGAPVWRYWRESR